MKALLQWTSIILIAVTAGQSDSPDNVAKISVKKCCQSGEVLSEIADKSKVQNPSCEKHDGKILKNPLQLFYPDNILDKIWNDIQASDNNNPGTLVNASLHLKEFQKIPKCVGGFEIHKLDAGKSDKI